MLRLRDTNESRMAQGNLVISAQWRFKTIFIKGVAVLQIIVKSAAVAAKTTISRTTILRPGHFTIFFYKSRTIPPINLHLTYLNKVYVTN